jgi:hypothetical protein
MHLMSRSLFILLLQAVFLVYAASAQLGNSGSIEGVVKDPSGAVVPGAAVQIANPISGLTRSAVTDTEGAFQFSNVPFNPYHLTAAARDLFRVRWMWKCGLAFQQKLPSS